MHDLKRLKRELGLTVVDSLLSILFWSTGLLAAPTLQLTCFGLSFYFYFIICSSHDSILQG